MGRPAIGKFTAVRLAPETLARIDALVPDGRRAEFIRHAVELALTAAETERTEGRGGSHQADSSQT